LASSRNYSWNHSLGETVTAVIAHGRCLEWLAEHDWTSWPRFSFLVEDGDHHWTMPHGMARVPLSFSLLARRPTQSWEPPVPGG
jgi:hypothetical protein